MIPLFFLVISEPSCSKVPQTLPLRRQVVPQVARGTLAIGLIIRPAQIINLLTVGPISILQNIIPEIAVSALPIDLFGTVFRVLDDGFGGIGDELALLVDIEDVPWVADDALLVDGVDVLAVWVGEEAVGRVVEVVARGAGGASAAGGPCGAVEVADYAFVLGGVEGVTLVALGAGFQVGAGGLAVYVGEFQALAG